MKLFLSWSRDRSKYVAESLRDWIPLILQHVEPWLSEVDLRAGERWGGRVATELKNSNFGILCLTQENVDSSWIFFEAGSLAKSLDESRVVPYLFDLEYSDLIGPLAQFQAKKADRAHTLEVVHAINQFSDSPIPDSHVESLFEPLWPRLEKKLKDIPMLADSPVTRRSDHEIMEDLVEAIRSMDQRLRRIERSVSISKGRQPPVVRNRDLPAGQILQDLIRQVFGPGDEFTLSDAYSLFVDPLSLVYPGNANIEAKIRQKFQELRNSGFLEFVDNRGKYRIRDVERVDVGDL